MSIFKLYEEGADVLGDGIDSFLPWLGVVGKVAGGLGGSSDKKDEKKSEDKKPTIPVVDVAAQVRQALDDERKRQQQEKLDADVRSMRTVMIVAGLGVAGFATWALLKR